MTYNVFGGTLNLTQSINVCDYLLYCAVYDYDCCLLCDPAVTHGHILRFGYQRLIIKLYISSFVYFYFTNDPATATGTTATSCGCSYCDYTLHPM